MAATWNVFPFFGVIDFFSPSFLYLSFLSLSFRSSEDVKLPDPTVGHSVGQIASNGPERESSPPPPAFRLLSAFTQTSAMVQGNTL